MAVLKRVVSNSRRAIIAKAICAQQARLIVGKSFRHGETLPPKKSYRRGYAVAVLIGFDSKSATLWNVFSKVVKPSSTLHIKGKEADAKALYNLFEEIVDALRPTFKEGVKSVILVSPPRTTCSGDFKNHVGKHHSWLLNGPTKIAFAELTGSANSLAQVTNLTRNPAFQKIVQETTTEETTNLLQLLETKLNLPGPREAVLYSIREAENLILPSKGAAEAEYLLLTDKYLNEQPERGRLNRLLQVAANKKVKTRIVKADSPAGKRLAQLGGFACLRRTT